MGVRTCWRGWELAGTAALLSGSPKGWRSQRKVRIPPCAETTPPPPQQIWASDLEKDHIHRRSLSPFSSLCPSRPEEAILTCHWDWSALPTEITQKVVGSAQGVIKEWGKGLGAVLKVVIGKNSLMYTVHHWIQTCQHIVLCTQAKDFRRRQKIPWQHLIAYSLRQVLYKPQFLHLYEDEWMNEWMLVT